MSDDITQWMIFEGGATRDGSLDVMPLRDKPKVFAPALRCLSTSPFVIRINAGLGNYHLFLSFRAEIPIELCPSALLRFFPTLRSAITRVPMVKVGDESEHTTQCPAILNGPG